ncbi:YraN family protein [Ferrimonas balearica]|uniref:YraN family protein n=1 Tax=Ferrimonas balearica TaxID=44012 RepID=UPI001C997117|nr:YraN family protein [Ferrimonas balearica]MBY5992107.1 YraN family protein [Ferrimonas balearica]
MRRDGQLAEQRAQRYLESQGLKALAQNVHGRFGELDLVMLDHPVVVFVEVKFRRSSGFGGALGAVTAEKQRKLRLTAEGYLQQQGWSQRPCRFDVLALDGNDINWIKNAF